jgi:hypothetical protein
LETIEGLPADHQVARQVLSSTTKRNENVIVGPVGNILRQTQVTMVLSVGTTEETSGGYIMHLRWQPIDDVLIRKPNGLSGGERNEGAGRLNPSGSIDSEYSKLVCVQAGKILPSSISCGAGTAQPQELMCFPIVGPL